MSSILKPLGVLVFLFSACHATAAIRVVNSTSNDANTIGTLPYWLLNADNGDTIDCSSIAGQSIILSASLPAITKNYTINGAGITIDGASSYQAFQIAGGSTVINNIRIQNALSKGGDGGDGYSGGGGAVGGGGALYIHGDSSLVLAASSLISNTARGGNGGAANNNGNAGAGGGGGFGGGNGGSSLTIVSTGGGGGGHSNGGNGGSSSFVNGSNGIYFGGGGGGAGINTVVPGGSGGNASPTGIFVGGGESGGNGGGGAGDSQDGFAATGSGGSGIPGNGGNGIGADLLFGAGGGGGSASETGFPGGIGVGAAGGGGGSNFSGGAGGLLGGGGGGGLGAFGGEGGFGAGGGGAVTGGIGGGSFNAGGGNGASDPNGIGSGGGGSGLGGAIFIQSNSTLTIIDAQQIANNSAIAGIGGSSTNESDPGYIPPGDGAAMGHDIFVREQGTIIFNLSNSLAIATPIEGDQSNGPNTSGGLQKLGNGILTLNGANTYSGLTAVGAGTLNLNGSVIGNTVIGSGGRLSGNATVLGNLASLGTGSIIHNDITAATKSLITVAGTASLAGILEINLAPDAQPGQYILLTSSGITGAFSSVRFSGGTPNYSLSYLPAGAPTYVQFNFLGYPSPPPPPVEIPATVNGLPILNPAVVCCGRPVILGPLPVPGAGPTFYSVINQTGNVLCQIGQTASQTYLKMHGKNGSCTIIGRKEGVNSNPLLVIAA
ncbi:hypothetical protein [Legionella quinlivanii]|uniref:hypothetical protein n=1 Tax=Legionella quinlivanii TaxID=45073 RepID=UPI0022445E11|nr:hypothetical protein [Legionella quinlivanii]MCW8449775.1 hypothetical protein [Legionella quinlivanii]